MKELYLLIEEEELNPQQQTDKKTGDSWSQNTVRWKMGRSHTVISLISWVLLVMTWFKCNKKLATP